MLDYLLEIVTGNLQSNFLFLLMKPSVLFCLVGAVVCMPRFSDPALASVHKRGVGKSKLKTPEANEIENQAQNDNQLPEPIAMFPIPVSSPRPGLENPNELDVEHEHVLDLDGGQPRSPFENRLSIPNDEDETYAEVLDKYKPGVYVQHDHHEGGDPVWDPLLPTPAKNRDSPPKDNPGWHPIDGPIFVENDSVAQWIMFKRQIAPPTQKFDVLVTPPNIDFRPFVPEDSFFNLNHGTGGDDNWGKLVGPFEDKRGLSAQWFRVRKNPAKTKSVDFEDLAHRAVAVWAEIKHYQ